MKSHEIAQFILAALVSVTGVTTVTTSRAHQESTNESEHPRDSAEDVTLAVTNNKGEHIGSAVSLLVESGSHWAVTNQHVVSGHSSVCLIDRSGNSHPFSVAMLPRDKKYLKQLDISFLRAPAEKTTGLAAARLKAMRADQVLELPIVVATGFPISTEVTRKKPKLSRSRGLLVPLLESELEEGYNTTYTAPIEKGMSGGGVFIDEELVAINGVHSDPLWDFRWKDRYGKRVDSSLNEKLTLVSIGISVDTILREFRRVESLRTKPSTINCNGQRTSGDRQD
jgi:hypothetical protein